MAPARRSASARAKAATKRTPAGEPVHGLRSLLADLGTICLNRIEPTAGGPAFDMLTTPTPLQQRAFDLLGVSPDRAVGRRAGAVQRIGPAYGASRSPTAGTSA